MANEVRWSKMMRSIVARPQESMEGCKHIDSLCDELLTEILLRLPNCKSVTQSKCVCKRWAALASHPGFSVNFIRLKLENGVCGIDLNKEHENFAIVMRYVPDRFRELWQRQEFQCFFMPSIFRAQDSSFSPIHGVGDDNAMVVASCQDLLLYCRHENDRCDDYYIRNAQTREWVMLPSPASYCRKKSHLVGFICDPFYSTINVAAYHYSVVVVCSPPSRSTKLCAHLYSSRCDGQWCDRILSLPKKCDIFPPGPYGGYCFCFDGKIHFSCKQGFFGFDHNSIGFDDDEIGCHLVNWPFSMLQDNHRVGVSQGSLHVSLFDVEKSTLSVWVLEDKKAGNWMLQHRVQLSEWVPRQPWIKEKLKMFSFRRSKLGFQGLVRVLGFHHSRSDAIYLLVPGCIFLCDLSTKTVELACRIPVAVAEEYGHYLRRVYGFPVIFQIWPTPLPPLAQGWSQRNSRLLP